MFFSNKNSAGCFPAEVRSAQEGGDKNTEVQVEGGVPPAVRKIQNLTNKQQLTDKYLTLKEKIIMFSEWIQ